MSRVSINGQVESRRKCFTRRRDPRLISSPFPSLTTPLTTIYHVELRVYRHLVSIILFYTIWPSHRPHLRLLRRLPPRSSAQLLAPRICEAKSQSSVSSKSPHQRLPRAIGRESRRRRPHRERLRSVVRALSSPHRRTKSEASQALRRT